MPRPVEVKYQVRWAKQFPSTRALIERMQSKRNPRGQTTIKLYCHAVMVYVKYYLQAATPEKALEQTRANLKETVDRFITYCMEKRDLSNKSARTMFYGVKYWLQSNDVDVSELEKIDLPKSNITRNIDRTPTREELQRLCTLADIRGKSIIEFAVASGLRLGTMLSLKWRDIVYDQATDSTRIDVIPQEGRKTSMPFTTFLTPEARKTLNEYKLFLEHREQRRRAYALKHSEQRKPLEPTAQDAFIFSNDKYHDSKLTTSSVQMWWARLLRAAGLEERTGQNENNDKPIRYTFHVLHFHVLRKYFKTACTIAGCRREFIEFWMGHTGQGLDRSYFRAKLEEHIAQYRMAIPQLSITEVSNVITREQLQREVLTALPAELLKPLADKHGLNVDQLRTILAKVKPKKTAEEEIEGLHSVLRVFKKKQSEDCQKIVNENELTEYLAKGWKVVSALPSGKIVVTSE
jgi:integrase